LKNFKIVLKRSDYNLEWIIPLKREAGLANLIAQDLRRGSGKEVREKISSVEHRKYRKQIVLRCTLEGSTHQLSNLTETMRENGLRSINSGFPYEGPKEVSNVTR